MLDTSAHVRYSQLHGSGFTDGNGAVWGDLWSHIAITGVAAKLSTPYYGEDYYLSPFVRAGFDYNLSSAQDIGVPAQAGFRATDLVIFCLPRDIGSFEAALKYWSFSDITVTLAANYNVSEIGSGYGGSLAVKIPLEALLTPPPPPPPKKKKKNRPCDGGKRRSNQHGLAELDCFAIGSDYDDYFVLSVGTGFSPR